jgi:hypothetical protein
MINLFNTAAYAEQLNYYTSTCITAACGCDGDMIDMNPDYSRAYTKEIDSGAIGTASVP